MDPPGSLHKTKIKLQIWDTAGSEQYRSINQLYYKKAAVVCLVYSTTDVESFDALDYWVKELNSHTSKNSIKFLIGSKIDDTENDEVSTASAKEYAKKMNYKNYAGYQDWRIPTAKEASTLYDRRKRNTDKDGDKIFIDSMFPKGSGWGTWTSDEKRNKAITVSYKDEGGKAYQDKLSGVDAFLRLVRQATPK